MRTLKVVFLAIACLLLFSFCVQNAVPKKVLIFSKTEGYRHESIPDGIRAIKKLGASNHFEVVSSEDSSYFTTDSLQQFDVILFLNTTGDILNREQELSMEQFVQSGGGFVGIHAATDTEYDWEWYGKLVGAYFESHPPGQTKARLHINDVDHPSTEVLPAVWQHVDEWYNFKNISPDINALVSIDESSYEGGTNGKNHPMSWVQDYDGGKMFYTALGHTKAAYTDEYFLSHILGGIKAVLGD